MRRLLCYRGWAKGRSVVTRITLLILLVVSWSRDLRGQGVQSPYPPAAGGEGYAVDDAARFHRAMDLENWDDGGELSRFVYLHPSQFFPAAVIHRRGIVSELVYDLNPEVGTYNLSLGPDSSRTLDQYIAESPIDGFIVLHQGRIVYEAYPRMQPQDSHLLFSVTKAIVGTAVGILEDRKEIDLRHGIDVYIPELRGTAWEGISGRDILEMSSGMEQSEMEPGALTDPTHKHYQLEASLGWLPLAPEQPEPVRQGETYEFLKALERVEEPGTQWRYTSSNTAVLGWLLERVTGKPLAQVLSEEIWSRIGAELDALMVETARLRSSGRGQTWKH